MTKKRQSYTPSQKILERYAAVMVNFGLNGGKGMKRGDVVQVTAAESAKPLLLAVRNAIVESGGHVIMQYLPDDTKQYNFSKDFFARAQKQQLDFFPKKYAKGVIDTIDHSIYIISEVDKESLKGVDPKKIMQRSHAFKPAIDWRRDKEAKGKFSWTLCMYGTPEMAAEVGLSPRAYWNEIIKACYLREKDPVATWKKLYRNLEKHRQKLNRLMPRVAQFHVHGPDADLWITPGEKRQWLGGRGCNIPSFELFTSPDWRGTNGWIRFNHPLYRYGNIIKGIELEFKNGKVVRSSATSGGDVIAQMIKTKDADKIGEFSLTDKRFSKITKPMGETLFDENMGGPHGNTHIALGSAYLDAYTGDVSKLTKKQAEKLGFNNSSVHTDVISTTKRTVTAHLTDGSDVVVYKNGMYAL